MRYDRSGTKCVRGEGGEDEEEQEIGNDPSVSGKENWYIMPRSKY